MRSGIPVVLGAWLAAHAAWAQPASSVDQELMKLVRAGGDLMIKKDRAGLEQLYTDDYIYTHSNGSVTNKSQEIAETIASDQKWMSAAVTDMKVRVYGDVGLVLGVSTLQGTARGYVPGPRRFTDVFVRRSGRWQQVGGASTIVAAGAATPANNTTALSAVKQLAARAMTPKNADEKAVLAADQAAIQAELANDAAKAGALQTKDHTFVSRAGALLSPTDPPGQPNKSIVTAYDHVQSLGSAVIIHGSLLWTDVQSFSPGTLRFMRVWVKEGPGWKLAAEQRVPIAAAARPSSQ